MFTHTDLAKQSTSHPGMWVSFQQTLLFLSLYVSATSLGTILHFLVNKYLKDAVEKPSSLSSLYLPFIRDETYLLKASLASLVISYPIFVTLLILLKSKLYQHPALQAVRFRKVLIYITLVIAFTVMLSSTTTALTNLLTGKSLVKLLAHWAIIFGISAGIFYYFFLDVTKDRKIND